MEWTSMIVVMVIPQTGIRHIGSRRCSVPREASLDINTNVHRKSFLGCLVRQLD
jgi:hypothetical protein